MPQNTKDIKSSEEEKGKYGFVDVQIQGSIQVLIFIPILSTLEILGKPWCFPSQSKINRLETRKSPSLKTRKISPSFFYLSHPLIVYAWLTIGKAICFTQSTYWYARVIGKQQSKKTQGVFAQIPGCPAAQLGWHINTTLAASLWIPGRGGFQWGD